MRIWIISDTHLGHDKMQELCGRPPDFTDRILNGLANAGFNEHDCLVHIGDVCIGRDKEWHDLFLRSLGFAFSVCLVRGNHDKKSLTWYMDRGYNLVCDRLDYNIFGHRIALSHKPLPDDGSYDLNIHGHLHNTGHHPGGGDKHVLFTLEHHYKPMLLRSMVEQWESERRKNALKG